jgi:cell wall-associated NlpC family hydrolase
MTDGIAAVMSRIQDIQGRIGQLSARTPTTMVTAAPDTTLGSAALGSGEGSQGFSGALASALADPTTGTPTTTTPPTGTPTTADPTASTGATGDPAATGSAGSSAATGEQVVADARRYLGVPYVWGGTDPDKGLDCSGLVQRVYADLGIKLPRVSGDQARTGRPVASVADAKPGDIVAFGRPVHHVGIYVGDGKMIAAPYPGKNVRIEPLPSTPTAIRRVIGAEGEGFQATAATSGLRAAASPAATLDSGTPYGRLFEAASARNDLPAGLLAAVAKAESGFNPNVTSPAGAQGLMQLMPATAQGLGVNAFDPVQAIDGAARLLKRNLKDFGSVPLALAAYNAGPGAVRRYGGVPPYAETQTYVTRVQQYQKELVR